MGNKIPRKSIRTIIIFAGVFMAVLALVVSSTTPVEAEDYLCYPCLLETDGADYCRYYEYEVFYVRYVSGMGNPCNPDGGYRDSVVGGGRGAPIPGGRDASGSLGLGFGKVGSLDWCTKLVTNEARTYPPHDSAGRCYRTFLNGKLFAKSRHNISSSRPRGLSLGKSARSGKDYVERGTKFRSNGKIDALFAAQVTAPNHIITGITVENTNGQRSVWDTYTNNRFWLGVAVLDGRVISHSDGTVNHRMGSGTSALNFYCEDNGSVLNDRTDFRMTIDFANGAKVVIPFGR